MPRDFKVPFSDEELRAFDGEAAKAGVYRTEAIRARIAQGYLYSAYRDGVLLGIQKKVEEFKFSSVEVFPMLSGKYTDEAILRELESLYGASRKLKQKEVKPLIQETYFRWKLKVRGPDKRIKKGMPVLFKPEEVREVRIK